VPVRLTMRLAGLALVPTVMVACGQPATSQKGPSPSPGVTGSSTTASASPNPTTLAAFPVATDVTCPDLGPFGLNLYLERPSDYNRHEAVLCVTQQLDRPLALHALDSAQTIGFVSDTVIGYVQQSGNGPPDASGAIKTLDLTSQQVKTVATSQSGFIGPVAWSHDQSMVAFTTDTGDTHHFWLKRGADEVKALTSPIQLFGRGGIEGDEGLVAFSPDDQYVLFADTAVYRLQVFRTSDGSAAYTAPSGQGGLRTMATWAHKSDQMYFRNDSGIYRWDPTAGISSFAAGVRWENPVFSPDDHYLAYTVWNSAGIAHVVIRDTTNSQTTSSPPSRLSQEFLSNVVLLEQVTQPCGTEGPCGPFNRTGSTSTLRIDSGAERQLPMPTGWGLDAFWQGH
jgi:hypothetical protein